MSRPYENRWSKFVGRWPSKNVEGKNGRYGNYGSYVLDFFKEEY